MIAADRSQTLLELFHSLYRIEKASCASIASVHQHEVQLRHFEQFLGRPPKLDDLNNDTVVRLIAWMLQERGQASATVSKGRAKLLAQWRFYDGLGLTQEAPNIPATSSPTRARTSWNALQLRTLFDALGRMRGDVAGVPAAGWWLALHLVLADTRATIGMLLTARWDDVDLEGGWLGVLLPGRRGCREDRIWRLRAETVAALCPIERPQRELVFPWNRAASQVWTRYTTTLNCVGLPSDRGSKFDRIRNTDFAIVVAALRQSK